jgi:hypothetical protein
MVHASIANTLRELPAAGLAVCRHFRTAVRRMERGRCQYGRVIPSIDEVIVIRVAATLTGCHSDQDCAADPSRVTVGTIG